MDLTMADFENLNRSVICYEMSSANASKFLL